MAPVSVIIPCFNCAQTLERALASIDIQTMRPAEVVLVDDASTDSTLHVIEHLRERYGYDWIHIIAIKENGGPASARNTGWDAATQPYLAFLDADDSWHPRKIEVQWAFMEAHPELDLCGHGFSEVAVGGMASDTTSSDRYEILDCAHLLFSNRLATRTIMLKRLADYRFRTGKRYAEDYLLWLQMACDGRHVAVLDQQLAYTYKAPYGVSGLSGDLWCGEKGELEAYRILVAEKRINNVMFVIASIYSGMKYLRRLLLVLGRRCRRPNLKCLTGGGDD